MHSKLQTQLIKKACKATIDYIKDKAPLTEDHICEWLLSLGNYNRLHKYFLHPRGAPFFLLPWLLEETIEHQLDTEFQYSLIYSNINAYLFVRIIDNVMDQHYTNELQLLPITAIFHEQFQRSYFQYFTSESPFWQYFANHWAIQADTAAKETFIDIKTENDFINISSKKISGMKIPLAAVCYRYNKLDVLNQWEKFSDLFGLWHLFEEDFFDWFQDNQLNYNTFFLSQHKTTYPKMPVEEWYIDFGFDWGAKKLSGWMDELKKLAHKMNQKNNSIVRYLEMRDEIFNQKINELQQGIKIMSKINQSYK